MPWAHATDICTRPPTQCTPTRPAHRWWLHHTPCPHQRAANYAHKCGFAVNSASPPDRGYHTWPRHAHGAMGPQFQRGGPAILSPAPSTPPHPLPTTATPEFVTTGAGHCQGLPRGVQQPPQLRQWQLLQLQHNVVLSQPGRVNTGRPARWCLCGHPQCKPLHFQ